MINHNQLADLILTQKKIITFTDSKDIYCYNPDTGLYEPGEILIEQIAQNTLKEDTKNHYINELKEAIRRKTYINREQLTTYPHLIPLTNGIYNLQNDTIINYSPEYIFLKKHPIKIINTDKDITEPNPIDAFITDITENQEYALLLKEIIGYCFYRKIIFQNFFILVGKGANGKSTYLDLLRIMLGNENVSNHSLQALTENNFALATLFEKNANIFGDLPKTAFKDVGIIKQLTGGDVVEANQKFKNFIRFKNYAKLISSCNEIPETPDNTDAFYRRAVIINFPKNFEGKNANPNILEEITSNEENMWLFFRSCISAFKMAMEDNQLIINETIEQKRDKYQVYSNSAIAFCNYALEYDPESYLTCEELLKEYHNFCKKKQVAPRYETQFYRTIYQYFGNKVFRRRVKEEEVGNHRVYVIQGLAWKENYAVG